MVKKVIPLPPIGEIELFPEQVTSLTQVIRRFQDWQAAEQEYQRLPRRKQELVGMRLREFEMAFHIGVEEYLQHRFDIMLARAASRLQTFLDARYTKKRGKRRRA